MRVWAAILGIGVLLGAAGAALVSWGSEAPAVPYDIRYAMVAEGQAARRDAGAEPSPVPVRSAASLPQATPRPAAPVVRIVIPSIDIDARVFEMGVLSDGTMETPDTPDAVAWYRFTSKPGFGGNAVFSGHLDFIRHGPAVFWRLRELGVGDTVAVVLSDGTRLDYTVVSSNSAPADSLDMTQVLAPGPDESVTLITCAGQFAAGAYTDRLVVRAARLP